MGLCDVIEFWWVYGMWFNFDGFMGCDIMWCAKEKEEENEQEQTKPIKEMRGRNRGKEEKEQEKHK